ncbi:MAG: hypothetical protein ACLVK8_02065 [Ruminococcus sp.]
MKTRQKYQNNEKTLTTAISSSASAKVSQSRRLPPVWLSTPRWCDIPAAENVRYWDEDDLMDDYYLNTQIVCQADTDHGAGKG